MKLTHFLFTPGQDQSVDPASLPPGGLVSAVNLRPTRTGRVGKRPATTGLEPEDTSAVALDGFPTLVGHSGGTNLLGVDGTLYAERADGDWESVGLLPYATPEGQWNVQHPGEISVASVSAVYHDGLLAVTYSYVAGGGGRARLRVMERETRKVLLEQDVAANVSGSRLAPQLLQVSGAALLWFYHSASDLKARDVDLSALTVGSEVAVASVSSGQPPQFAAVMAGGDATRYFLALAYGNGNLTLDRRLVSDHSVVDTVTVGGTSPQWSFGVVSDATRVYVGYLASAGYARARVYSHDLSTFDSGAVNIGGTSATISGESNFEAAVLSIVSGTVYFAYRANLNSDGRRLRIVTLDSAGAFTNVASEDEIAGVTPYSPLFAAEGRLWLWAMCGDEDAPLRHYELLEIRAGETPRAIPHLVADGQADNSVRFVPQEPVELDSGNWLWWQVVVLRGEGETNPQTAAREWEWSWLGEQRRQLLDAAGVGIIPGGVLTQWDGAGLTEATLAHSPAILSTSENASGNLTQLATYQYSMVWERFDALGRRHRSAPANPVSETLSSTNDGIDLTVVPIGGAQRATWAGHLYRTTGNGSVFQRATAMSSPIDEFTAAYSDTLIDLTLAEREVLYTEGGVLPSDGAPASRFGCVALGRIWLGGLFVQTRIRCSTELEPNNAPGFPEDATHWLDFPSQVTGLAALEDALVVFTERGVYIVAGSGPSITGDQAYPAPRPLPTDLGCVNWRSVLTTSAGVFYQSRAGLMLLARSGSVPEYVGRAVANEDLGDVVAVGVAEETDGAVARFLYEGLAAPVVAVSLRPPGAWTMERYTYGGPSYGTSKNLGSRLGSDGRALPVFADAQARLLVLDEAEASFVGGELVTGEIAPAGHGVEWRLNRCWLQVYYRGACDVTAEITYDADPSSTADSQTWSLSAGAEGQRRFLEWRPRRQQCHWASFRVTDSSGTPGSRGVEFVGMTLEWEPVGGAQVATAQRR